MLWGRHICSTSDSTCVFWLRFYLNLSFLDRGILFRSVYCKHSQTFPLLNVYPNLYNIIRVPHDLCHFVFVIVGVLLSLVLSLPKSKSLFSFSTEFAIFLIIPLYISFCTVAVNSFVDYHKAHRLQIECTEDCQCQRS